MQFSPFPIFILAILTVLCGCAKKEPVSQLLQGEWLEYNAKRAYFEKEFGSGGSRSGQVPEAFRITADSIEFYNGIFVPDKREYPAFPNHHFIRFCTWFSPYRLSSDSIFMPDCETKKWQYYTSIQKVTKDSLVLASPDFGRRIYLRPKPAISSREKFDQVVYSFASWSTGYQISVESNGRVYAKDCMPGKDGFCLDVYWMKLSPEETAHIFSKITQANPLMLRDDYPTGSLDGSMTTISFIKHGRIVKTIADKDESAPDRLYWAYLPIKNLRNDPRLQPLPKNKPVRFIFTDLGFRKNDSLHLDLKAAEMHFLWTELYKATLSQTRFQPKFRFTTTNTSYAEVSQQPKFNERTKHYGATTFDSVTTDGRYYRFYPKSAAAFTLDLGYDFIARHFPEREFEYNPVYDEPVSEAAGLPE